MNANSPLGGSYEVAVDDGAAESRGPDSENRRLRTRLVEANMSLVVKAARLLRGKGVPFADLVQEGSLALLAAIEKLEPTSELEFKKSVEFAIEERLRDVVEATDSAEARSRGLLVNARAPDPREAGLEAEKIEKTHELLSMLAEDQEQVLRLRFGIDTTEPSTLEAAGRALGINRWRVSGLESRALAALRKAVHRLRWTFPR